MFRGIITGSVYINRDILRTTVDGHKGKKAESVYDASSENDVHFNKTYCNNAVLAKEIGKKTRTSSYANVAVVIRVIYGENRRRKNSLLLICATIQYAQK